MLNFIKFFHSDICINYKEKENIEQNARLKHHTITSNKTQQFVQLSENQLGIQSQNDLGRSQGWINPCSSAELDGRCQDSSVPLELTSGSFFLLPHLQLIFVWLFHLMSFLFCMFFCMLGLTPWVVLQDALCRQAGKQFTEITSVGQLVMHFPQMGCYCFNVAPNLKHQGKNDFNPTLKDTLEHLKASLEYSPWRPTMILVIPFS